MSVETWISFRTILARVVSTGAYTRFGRTFEDERRRMMDEDRFRISFILEFPLMYLYPFLAALGALYVEEEEEEG